MKMKILFYWLEILESFYNIESQKEMKSSWTKKLLELKYKRGKECDKWCVINTRNWDTSYMITYFSKWNIQEENNEDYIK